MTLSPEFVQRTCIGDPEIHAKIMHEASAWVQQCNYDRKKAMDSTGQRGDLYFVIKAHEDEFFKIKSKKKLEDLAELARENLHV